MAIYTANHPVVKQLEKYMTAKYLQEAEHKLRQECEQYMKRIESAVSSLPEQERELIEKRYLVPEYKYTTDQHVYRDVLMISHPRFRVLRERAFKKLAIVLGMKNLNEKDDE